MEETANANGHEAGKTNKRKTNNNSNNNRASSNRRGKRRVADDPMEGKLDADAAETANTAGSSTSGAASNVCFQWSKTGSCRRGKSCKFLHPELTTIESATETVCIPVTARSNSAETKDDAMTIEESGGNKSEGNEKVNSPSDVCRQWAKSGYCRRGDNCKFRHPKMTETETKKDVDSEKVEVVEKHRKRETEIASSSSTGPVLSDVCRQWVRTGACKRGDYCKYRHPPREESKVDVTRDSTRHSGTDDEYQGNHVVDQNQEADPIIEVGGGYDENSPANICRQWAKSGSCRRGNKCRYLHPTKTEESAFNKNREDQSSNKTEPNVMETTSSEYAIATAKTVAHVTDKRFADLPISNEGKRAMNEVFRYEFMTVVQAETLPIILKGTDVLAKAKTGTGKTLGFLIPSVELLIRSKKNSMDIGCLIISPTRELAFQIGKEAESLVTYHRGLQVAVFVGGTNIQKDRNVLKSSIQILVTTPGRFLDHLQNTDVAGRLSKLAVLVLDEADQLLDMGFRPDIERILGFLEPSKSTRQTLLFSATIPSSVSEIAAIALRPSFEVVDTVGENEEQTHLHVEQHVCVMEQKQQTEAVAAILQKETLQKPYKIIVFFTTARLTGFMAEMFNSLKKQTGYDVLEIHSRKSQAARQRASDEFRRRQNAVLFSSDVSARGMDYPDVTFVLQVGLTERAQYIHRLGRTARAGKQGHGALLLAPYEETFMVTKELRDLPLKKMTCPILSEVTKSGFLTIRGSISENKELRESAEQAYRAWLGYYNGALRKCGWDKKTLVLQANQWAKEIGLTEQPSLLKKTVGKMGLKGVPGLVVE